MATIYGTVDKSLQEASAAIRQVAATQGWALREEDSGTAELALSKDVSLFSLGSRMGAPGALSAIWSTRAAAIGQLKADRAPGLVDAARHQPALLRAR